MKVSAVTQGLKSLADKIHPQLPLTARESQRLLTALTSSFRQKLDEAHPKAAGDDGKNAPKGGAGGVSTSKASGIHSSASYADKHLASVLTNPLLMQGGKRLDYGSAKVDLARNLHKDSIELLEEYQEKGAATIRIAELCMEHLKKDLTSFSHERKQEYIQQHEPGRRVFSWLLRSNRFDSADYVDSLKFMDLMAYFLIEEKREENLWDLIKLDLCIADTTKPAPANTVTNKFKQKLHQYRWRGRLLRSMVDTKLGTYGKIKANVPTQHIHDAMDTFFMACELKRSVTSASHLYWIPLGGAGSALHNALTHDFTIRHDLDVGKFERFVDCVPLYSDRAPMIYQRLELAVLALVHPREHSADPGYLFLKDLFSDPPSREAQLFLPKIRDSHSLGETTRWFIFMARVASVLQEEGRHRDAVWVGSQAKKKYPKFAHYFDFDVARYVHEDQHRRPDVAAGEKSSRIPFPTFA